MEELDAFGKYESGRKVTEKPEILFARMDLEEVLAKAETAQTGSGTSLKRKNP